MGPSLLRTIRNGSLVVGGAVVMGPNSSKFHLITSHIPGSICLSYSHISAGSARVSVVAQVTIPQIGCFRSYADRFFNSSIKHRLTLCTLASFFHLSLYPGPPSPGLRLFRVCIVGSTPLSIGSSQIHMILVWWLML